MSNFMFARTRQSLLTPFRLERSGPEGSGGVPDSLADSLPEPVLHAGWSELGPVPWKACLEPSLNQSGYLARRKAARGKRARRVSVSPFLSPG